MRDFTGKVALVTGSSSGIGACVAKHFAQHGGSVVVTGRNKDNIKKIADECAKLSKQGEKAVLQVVGDITKDADLDKLMKETINKFGKLDILVNNAGVSTLAPIDTPDYMKQYEKIFNTNVRSVMYLTRLAIPHLLKTKGVIVNISSCASLRPLIDCTIYNAAKSALDMFSRCLALELGPKGIRVNIINPAGVNTNFVKTSEFKPELLEKLMVGTKPYPLGRIGEPEDIAKAIAYLASDDSSFVTGGNLVLDGGALWN